MPLSSVLGAASVIKAGVVTSGTRPSVPYAGQLIYETDTNRLAAYNGSAWVSKDGLQLIKTQTVGSAVSSVQVTGAFSATYDSYKIIYEGGTSSAACRLNMTLGASTTNYSWSTNIADFTNAGVGAYNGNATSSWAVGSSDTSNTIINFDIYDPFLNKQTYGSANWFREPGTNNLGAPRCFHTTTASYTDFTITPSTGTITGGTIRVYGYANS